MVKYFKSVGGEMQALDEFEKKCWIDLINPTDDELENVCSLTGVSEDMLKAALDEEERARTESDDGNVMYLVDSPTIEESETSGDTYSTIPISIVYNQKCIITVSLHGNPVLKDFISDRTRVNTSMPIEFVLKFLLGNAKRFLATLRQIDKRSHRVQAELHRSMKNKEIIQLLELENSLVYFSTSLTGNSRVHDRLSRNAQITAREDYQDLYEDLIIETKQAAEMCNIYRDILSITMDAFGSVISNNVNIVMKLLTVVTLIISIPTLIASLWGMNVKVPFEDTPWGFWVVLGFSVVITAICAVFITKYSSQIRVKKEKSEYSKRKPASRNTRSSSTDQKEKNNTTGSNAKKSSDPNKRNTAVLSAKNTTVSNAKKTAEQNAKNTAEQNAKNTVEHNAKNTAEQNAKNTAEQNAKNTVEQNAKNTAEQNAKNTVEHNAKNTAETNAKNTTGQSVDID